jgi:four helix bundle protein
MDNEELIERTKKFALRCMRLAFALQESKIEQYIRTQLVDLSASCALNMRSARLAEKRIDQMAKYRTALEAIDGCCFWIECIISEAFKKQEKVNPLLAEALELQGSIGQYINTQGNKRTTKSSE